MPRFGNISSDLDVTFSIDRYNTEATTNSSLASTAAVIVEKYLTVQADGHGFITNQQSDTPSTNNKIVRKIWYKANSFEASDVTTWTLVNVFADNTSYNNTETYFNDLLKTTTYGTPPFTLAQTWEETAAFDGLLDTYTGAAAAYSLRLLDSTYTGDAIRVRRASDNAEQDIGFTAAGDLDTSALATFCAGTDGFVVRWYDQSGNSNDAVQVTTANQPKVYDSVTGVVTENGKPAVEFLDSADILASSSAREFNSVLQNELYCVASYGTINVGNQYAAGVQIGGSSRGVMIGTNSSGDDIRYHCDGVGFEIAVGGTIAVDTQILHGGTYDGTTRHARLNGASVGTNTDAGITGAANAYFIGKHPSLTAGAGKKVQEFILYPAYNGNESGIESNINDYYSIYTP